MKTIILISTIIYLFLSNANIASGITIRIYAFEHDVPKRVVECEIYKKGKKSLRSCIYEEGKDERIGYISRKGYEEIDLACSSGERIILIPLYRNMDPKCIRCPVEDELNVDFTIKKIIENLLSTAKDAIERKEYATAAFAYVEISLRITEYRGIKSNWFLAQAYASMAKFFRLPIDQAYYYNPRNDLVKMSDALFEKIKVYQEVNKIKVKNKGNLELNTLIHASNKQPFEIIYAKEMFASWPERFEYNPARINLSEIERWLSPDKTKTIKIYLNEGKTNEVDNPAEASLAYSNALAELSRVEAPNELKTNWLKNIETKVYESFGKFLKVENPYNYDPLQNKNVMTYEMLDSVKKFQMKNDVRSSGILNFETLSKASQQNM